MRSVFLSTLAMALLSACTINNTPPAAPAVDIAAEQAKIREAEATNLKNWTAKDVEGVLTFYADDATLMTPGMPAMKGKDAMRPVLKTMLADPNLKLEYSAQRIEVSKTGDVAFSQGTYLMTMTDAKTKKPVTDKGSYVTAYKKQADGNWKAVSDINVSEVPPAS